MAGDLFPTGNVRCERAREWSSLRLDGELSDFERLLLDRHLARCEGCRAFEAELRAATALVRSVPAERPSERFEPARPREVHFPVHRRLAVALIAAAAALGSLMGSTLQRPAAPAHEPPPQLSLLPRDVAELRELARPRHVTPGPLLRQPPGPPEGAV